MNWDAVGALAELTGSVAVVVTLIFLVVQLRHNSTAIRNATAQHSSSATSGVLSQLTLNPELLSIYRRGLKHPDDLTKDELGRFDFLLIQMFRDCDVQYQNYKNGGTGQEQWDAVARTIGSVAITPGGRASWNRQKHYFSTSFQAALDELLDDA